MKSLTFVLGGARSGKSRYAERIARSWSERPVYLATSRAWDDDHRARIERHQLDRGDQFETFEEEKFPSRLELTNRVVLFDCVTLYLTNHFVDVSGFDNILASAHEELERFFEQDNHLILVSNEVGLSLHAETEAGRKFTDLQGFLNQRIAERADRVIFMVAGLPLVVKGNLPGERP